MIGSEERTEQFHFLPCKIDYDGEARVSDFFIVDAEPDVLQKDQKSLDSFRTTLRGRGLQACDLDLEKRFGYSSIVIEKKGNALESDWKFDVKASSMKIWNHDQRPSYLNCPVMCLPGWIELANAIHND